jgi:hypothetical protein
MIDHISYEILVDFGYPTNLVELMVLACEMLTTNNYLPENNMGNMRIRSNEIIAHHVYNQIADAYGKYRKTAYKKNPTPVSIKQNSIISLVQQSPLLEETSVLNPVLELEKNRSITYKGERGINLDRSLTLEKRPYDESMLGILGITTPGDANVGVLRQMSLEPMITSTRGYLSPGSRDKVEELSAANLLTPSELLTPLGLIHDDPTRSSMTYKQSKYMIPIDDADPVMIGNKVESIIPYHTSDEFSVVAKDSGTVIDIKDNVLVIEYKNGRHHCINLDPTIKKNASSGFYLEVQLSTNKQIGDKIKKGEVVAWNDKIYKKNVSDLSASMRLGVLAKIAIVPSWDGYEDSTMISDQLSKKLASDVIVDKEVALHKSSYIEYICKIGDEVKTGDTLIKFDKGQDDELVDKFLEEIRKTMDEDVVENFGSVVRAKYSGVITDIRVYSTVDVEELHPSIQDLIKKNYNKINRKNNVYNKYKNPEDNKYYKAGNLITEYAEKIKPDAKGAVKGVIIDSGVLIIFYIKYKDYVKKGDEALSP